MVKVNYKKYNSITLIKESGGHHATGFSIAYDGKYSYILTNRHVCYKKDNAKYILIGLKDDLDAEFLVNAPITTDLCILKTKAYLPPLKLATKFPKYGDRTFVIGAPDGTFPIITEGFLSFKGSYQINSFSDEDEQEFKIADINEDTDFLMEEIYYDLLNIGKNTFYAHVLSAPIYHGSSGSPVFNKDSKVIGIIFATRSPILEHISIMIPIDEIYKFLYKIGIAKFLQV